ncbi:M20/M25/M40 family metallo-hydrolase [Nakamurella alba]|nr:M20/M25/M40 family metallo-hydrolase [Nakamurella alba]
MGLLSGGCSPHAIRRVRTTVAGMTVDRERMVDELARMVAVPSIGIEPEHGADVLRSAQQVAEAFRAVGVPVEVVTAGGGAPAVIGRREGPAGAPTVLLYAHHDVQPVGRRDEWGSEPFELTERDGRLYGRGSADDKGGVVVHLETLRELGEHPPVGIAVLIEGEEEIGSPTLQSLLDEHAKTLRADLVLAPDSVNPAPMVPSLTVSLRGLLSVGVSVRTMSAAVHSGIFGGAVPDALTALVRLLDSLVTPGGSPAVAGLHPGTGPSASVAPTEAGVRKGAGVLEGVELIGAGPLGQRLFDAPSVSVLGLDAPPTAGAANVLHPSARATVGFRLAPEDDPVSAFEAVRAHLEQHAPWGVQLEVELLQAGRGWRGKAGPVADLARTALTGAFGSATVDVGVGGGIPFVAAVSAALPDAAVLVTGVQDDRTRAHAPDESVDPDALVAMAQAQVELLRSLG